MRNEFQLNKDSSERDWLIEKHKPIVYYLAKKISHSLPFKTEIEDLIAYGQLGLVEASERFDPSRGNSFSTFAHYRIKGAIYDGLREMGVITRSRTHRFAAHANDILVTVLDDTDVALSTSADDEIKTVENLIDTLIPIYFLSLDDDETREIQDETALTSVDFETRDLIAKIRSTIEEIEPEESKLLKELYFKNVLMKDLAVKMGVTKSWISRLHTRAIKHLQSALIKNGVLGED